MITTEFKYGLHIANWQNKLHPENPGFMQIVRWTADWNPSTNRWKAGYGLEYGKLADWPYSGMVDSLEGFKKIIENLQIKLPTT